MPRVLEILLGAVIIAIFLLPVIAALVVATFAAKLFSVLFHPITAAFHELSEKASERFPNPLEKIPAFSTIKNYFGSPKNILFIGFVMIFLIIHYQTLSDVGAIYDNISLLFPGTALDQVLSYGTYDGTLDLSSFFVNPESYLQTIIYSAITGLFMHIGCTTKADGARVHILVKILYTLLISLFSSIVLGMIPEDMFHISFSEVSFDFGFSGAATGGSDFSELLAEVWEWAAVLLEKLVNILPTVVALYFLSHAVSGFAAAFLGGMIALCSVGLAWPEGLSNPDSALAVFLILAILVAGEVIALLLGEKLDELVEGWLSKTGEVPKYYNIVSLLIAYFFYPTLALALLSVLSQFINGFDIAILLFGLVCLLVFSLATFVGFKITQWTTRKEGKISGLSYSVAMVFNVPIWIIYILVFVL